MAIVNFGPSTILWGSTDLGKTTGGGSLTLNTQQFRTLRTQTVSEYITGGTGTLDLYQLTTDFNLLDDMVFHDYGILHIHPYLTTSTNKIYIHLRSCKLFYPTNFTIGTLDQKPLTIRLTFRPDPVTPFYVITIKSVDG
jgi:hypothetical protein